VKRLIYITQAAHPEHPALGVVLPQLRALAARLDEIVIITAQAAPEVLPANCRVRYFTARTKLGRGLRFYRSYLPELARRPRAVLAHMCPIYAILAAPLARPLGIRVVLWFSHWRRSLKLRLAERLSTCVISPYEGSFPLASPKLVPIGHGIDLETFPCRNGAREHDGVLRALALGRYADSKGFTTLLRAARIAADRGLEFRLRIHGPVLTPGEREYRAELERLHDELQLDGIVELGDAVPRTQLPRLFDESDVLINNMRRGSPDKVAYEASAAGLPVLASSPTFDELFSSFHFSFERDDPESLADLLIKFSQLKADERRAIGMSLRARVEELHSLEAWADRVVAAAGLA
jgi:glycosyltransferase involved in cell wall biosynthesis